MTTPHRPHGAAPQSDTTLLFIAKQPLPGRVKTRLVPPCTPEQAAALAADGGFWALWLRVPDPALVRRFAAQVRELAPLLDPATATRQASGAVREQV